MTVDGWCSPGHNTVVIAPRFLQVEGLTHTWSQMAPGEGYRAEPLSVPPAKNRRLSPTGCVGHTPLALRPSQRLLDLGAAGKLGEPVSPSLGVLGLCPSLWLARTCHGISGAGQLSSGFQAALPGSISPYAAAKGGKGTLQRGIFPLTLNKFHLFVLGTETGITPCTDANAEPKRGGDSHVAASPPIGGLDAAAAAQRLKSFESTHTLRKQKCLSGCF